MAGVSIHINTEGGQVIGTLCDGLLSRFADQEPAMHIIGATVEASVQRNFEKEGRPENWEPLAAATLESKKNTQILQVKGHGGGLLGSIHYEATAKAVTIGTNKIYGAIHQLGGKAGRGHKVTIPARPFLLVQDEDWPEINATLADYYLERKK